MLFILWVNCTLKVRFVSESLWELYMAFHGHIYVFKIIFEHMERGDKTRPLDSKIPVRVFAEDPG